MKKSLVCSKVFYFHTGKYTLFYFVDHCFNLKNLFQLFAYRKNISTFTELLQTDYMVNIRTPKKGVLKNFTGAFV